MAANYYDVIPKIVYQLDGDTQRLATNLLASVRRRAKKVTENYLIFDLYTVEDGDTPEIVADKLYGHTKYWWVVCLVAEIVKPKDWPISTDELERRMDDELGKRGRAMGYWIDSAGLRRASRVRKKFTDENGKEVNWYDHGEGLGVERYGVIFARGERVENQDLLRAENDARRQIQVLSPDFLSDFVAEYNKLMAEPVKRVN
jgi:hypothetical protein